MRRKWRLPEVVLWLPKWLIPKSVGCFKAPGGSGYICPTLTSWRRRDDEYRD